MTSMSIRQSAIGFAAAMILLPAGPVVAGTTTTIPIGDYVIRVWDSEWVPFPEVPPLEIALEHGLGGDPGAYEVSLKFRGFEGSGIHNNGIGGLFDHTSGQMQGSYFSELTSTSIKVTRYEDDLPVGTSPHAEFRLRIWTIEPYPTSVNDVSHGEDLPELRQNSPNPFGAATRIDFSLEREGRAAVRIYDVTGRLLATLVDREMPTGGHSVSWNGMDSNGRKVSAGTYFYELQIEGLRQSRKMVVLR